MKHEKWLISAGTGPEECAFAAALTLREMEREAAEFAEQGRDIAIDPLETEFSAVGNIRSCCISATGADAGGFMKSWEGTVQWIWRSAYRPGHKRKNWFVSVSPVAEAVEEFASESARLEVLAHDVRFETARAGGPGGQYVNKTESAVRAVHIPSGKSVRASGERSQLANKRRALALLDALLKKEADEKCRAARSETRHRHYELERGNPSRVYEADAAGIIVKRKEKRNGNS